MATTSSKLVEAGSWPVWGHESAVTALQRAIRGDKVSHAYLLTGAAGIGKRTMATVFAQALCCPTERSDPALPCGVCSSCRRVARGTHPDVEMVSLATQAAAAEKSGSKNLSLTIDTVRSLRSTAALRPMEGPRRVFIIDDAETLPGPAQEALLKTLEEPPNAVSIMLLSADTESLLPTIRSRCQVIELHQVASGSIVQGLIDQGVNEQVARELAAVAAGRPGWAVQAIGDESIRSSLAASVSQALAWVEAETYERLVTALRTGDGFAKGRNEVFADLSVLLALWRDVMLAAAGVPERIVHQAERERIAAIAARTELHQVAWAVLSVQRGIADLESNVRPRLALENMVLQWPDHAGAAAGSSIWTAARG